MNRLKYLSVYLVGPIDRCPNLGKGWRDDLTPFLREKGVAVLDPLDKPVEEGNEIDQREYRHTLKKSGEYEKFRQIMKEVRAVDLRFVDKADFFIVNYDTSIPMCGTFEEIFLANRARKPIIIMCPQGKEAIHDWLYGTLPYELFFENWDEVKAYLNYVDTATEVDRVGNRWLFFNRKV
jgi:nucleoside 2-deoxyribosyltransferase